MIYYAVVEGDPLDNANGSQVIGGADHSTIEDPHERARRQTHVGQLAWCGVCKITGPILAGAGIRENLRGWDGRLQAFEAVGGDVVLCKCTQHPRVVSVYARTSSYIDSDGASTVNALADSVPASSVPHDEQFTLRDNNGRVLAETYYTIRLPNGELIHGTTDSSGRTARHVTDGAQPVRIYLGHREFA